MPSISAAGTRVWVGSPLTPGRSPKSPSKVLFSRTTKNTWSMTGERLPVLVAGMGKSLAPAGQSTWA